MPNEDESIDDAARQILQYLEQHPQATDTLRGICAWWLQENGPPVPETTVSKALGRLIDDGCVDCKQTPGGYILYMRRTH